MICLVQPKQLDSQRTAEMYLPYVAETLLPSVVLTFLVAAISVVFSVFFGAALSFRADSRVRYGVALALLFVPFALGSSVWAYATTRFAIWSGLQGALVSGSTSDRFGALLFFCLARTVPLGAFFVATTLQRYTSEIRPYLRVHRVGLPFFLICALNRIPKSVLSLIGLFGGAVMASEAALPIFLYRANPGTQPETVNIILSRMFRETYALSGPETLSRVATAGLILSVILLLSAFIGALFGRGIVGVVHRWMRGDRTAGGKIGAGVATLSNLGMVLCFLPGMVGLAALFAPTGVTAVDLGILSRQLRYADIVGLGLLVGTVIVTLGIAVAVRLRYGKVDWLVWFEANPVAACVLMFPAFMPILTIVAVLGMTSSGLLGGLSGYVSLFVSHVGLHYPIFQFICMTLIAAIPERRVRWQRAMRMNFGFSLEVDGFKHHRAVLIGLLGLCTVAIVTDGSISRWFSHLVKAPEEALYAAIFGRLSNAAEATVIAWSVGTVAIIICSILALAYVRDLVSRPRYA